MSVNPYLFITVGPAVVYRQVGCVVHGIIRKSTLGKDNQCTTQIQCLAALSSVFTVKILPMMHRLPA